MESLKISCTLKKILKKNVWLQNDRKKFIKSAMKKKSLQNKKEKEGKKENYLKKYTNKIKKNREIINWNK